MQKARRKKTVSSEMCGRQIEVFVGRDAILETTGMAKPDLPQTFRCFDRDSARVDWRLRDGFSAKDAGAKVNLALGH